MWLTDVFLNTFWKTTEDCGPEECNISGFDRTDNTCECNQFIVGFDNKNVQFNFVSNA